jgi:hypothetical protein
MSPNELAGQQTQQHTKRLVRLLLTPSGFSVIVSAFLALGTAGFILFQGQYQGSDIQQQFLNWRVTTDADSPSNAATSFQQNTAGAVSFIELFIFWYAVGTAIYLVASTVYHTIRSANEARQHLYYVNISRSEFLRSLYSKLAIRFISLAVWVGYAVLTLKILLPYLLGAIHVADEHYPAVGAVGLLAGSILGLLLMLHIHVVFFRLILLRPRAFNGDAYSIMSAEH